MAVFIVQPHKEERFLFPIYPLLCLSAAIALQFTKRWLVDLGHKMSSKVNLLVFYVVSINNFLSGFYSLPKIPVACFV